MPRNEAENRRGFRTDAENASLYFDDLLFAKVGEFNPKYRETKGALTKWLRQPPANIFGNRDFLGYLRNQATFFDRTYFVYSSLRDARVGNARAVSRKVAMAFSAHPNWQTSQAERRALRQEITFAVFAAVEDFDRVTPIVDALFSRLDKS